MQERNALKLSFKCVDPVLVTTGSRDPQHQGFITHGPQTSQQDLTVWSSPLTSNTAVVVPAHLMHLCQHVASRPSLHSAVSKIQLNYCSFSFLRQMKFCSSHLNWLETSCGLFPFSAHWDRKCCSSRGNRLKQSCGSRLWALQQGTPAVQRGLTQVVTYGQCWVSYSEIVIIF